MDETIKGFFDDASEEYESGFKPLDAGKYLLEILEAETAFGKTSGNPYLHFQASVVEPERYRNRRIFDNLHFTPDTKDRTFHAVRIITGLGSGDVRARVRTPDLAGQVEAVRGLVIGKRFVGTVKTEKSKDRAYPDKNRIGDFESAQSWQGGASVKAEERLV